MVFSAAKKFLILGLGRSGLAAKKLLEQQGYDTKNIITFDEKASSANFSDITQIQSILFTDIIVSPGFPLKTPFLVDLMRPKNTLPAPNLWSEISLAFDLLTTEKIIAITGSIGKSTTSFIIHQMLLDSGQISFLGANFGIPLCEYVNDVYFSKKTKKADWLVLELSSYQLENIQNFSCEYSLITTLNKNHLDRYKNVDHYYQTKLSLLLSTKKKSFLNYTGYDLLPTFNIEINNGFTLPKSEARLTKLHEKPVNYSWVNSADIDWKFYLSNPFFKIKHNIEIAALVLSLAKELEIEASAKQTLLRFKGLEHRFEMFLEQNGCIFINDSKATSIESIISAIESAKNLTQEKIAILLGGKDKNLPWEKLSSFKTNTKLQFYFFGEVSEKAKALSGLDGSVFNTLHFALDYLMDILHKNPQEFSVVLLSPGGTSLDQFKSFEDRGLVFKSEILKHLQNWLPNE